MDQKERKAIYDFRIPVFVFFLFQCLQSMQLFTLLDSNKLLKKS